MHLSQPLICYLKSRWYSILPTYLTLGTFYSKYLKKILLYIIITSDITAIPTISKRNKSYLTAHIESHLHGSSLFLKTRKKAFVSFGIEKASITRCRVEESLSPFYLLTPSETPNSHESSCEMIEECPMQFFLLEPNLPMPKLFLFSAAKCL